MSTDEPMTFGRWVKARRKVLGLTQGELARQVACSVETIRKIEGGTYRPSAQLAELLAAGLHIAPAEYHAFVAFARARPAAPLPDLPTPVEARPSDPRPAPPGNLPVPPTSFIGRERELAMVDGFLRRADLRLLTLTGPPGIGKTRLALRAAQALGCAPGACAEPLFADGVFLVNLAAIRDPARVAPAIAQVLGVREAGAQPLLDRLIAYLRDKRVLLVLDNFEQVLAAAPLLSGLVEAAPQMKLLVTSREVLHLYGAQDFPVPPLSLPSLPAPWTPTAALTALAGSEAVQLFVTRAQAAQPDFALTPLNAPAIAAVCRRLDGLPLAIELITTHIKVLTPEEMLARLERRLPLLVGGGHNLPARQQTLRAAIDGSYELLGSAERTLFRRLAVFIGGCTLEAAEAVAAGAPAGRLLPDEAYEGGEAGGMLPLAGDVLPGVAALVDKGLLYTEPGRGASRFRMMETIREYALERLVESGEEDQVREAHALFFLRFAERAEPAVSGPDPGEWLDRLEDEHDNLRAALHWLGDRAVVAGARLSGALWWFWYTRAYFSEGRQWLEQSLRDGQALPPLLRAKVLHASAVLGWSVGDYATARARTAEALACWRAADDATGVAGALNMLGAIALQEGSYAQAGDLFAESLTLRHRLDDARGIALALSNLGLVTLNQGDYTRAAALLEESLARRRALQYKQGIAQSLNDLGVVRRCQGDLAGAAALHRESLALFRALGHRDSSALALFRLGWVALSRQDADGAAAHLSESLLLYRELEVRQGIAACLEGLLGVAVLRGQPARAATLGGAAAALRAATGTPTPPPDDRDYQRYLSTVRTELSPAAYGAAWAAGQALPGDQAVALALHPE